MVNLVPEPTFLKLTGCKEPMEPRKYLVECRSSPYEGTGRDIEHLCMEPTPTRPLL